MVIQKFMSEVAIERSNKRMEKEIEDNDRAMEEREMQGFDPTMIRPMPRDNLIPY